MTYSGNDSVESPKLNDHQTAVLVVGAGPTGLLLASELQQRGVPCHLIDALPGPLHWDRATVVHPRSLEIFESLGLVKKFLDAGCRQRVIRIHSDGKLLGSMDLSTCGSVYGFNVGLSEEVTESILTGYLHQHGGKVNRSSRLVGLTSHTDGALAEIECNGVRYRMNARWVVGCDGLHSPTREFSDIAFEGHEIARTWAVFDATLLGWTDTYEGNFGFLDTITVSLTAIPGQRWRVYLRPRSAESDLVADALSTLRTYMPDASFVNVENPTRFHCHTKIAANYRSGAVFLAGDAAHLCTPAEGHGMNCGLQDAFNLAWKLALVHHGAAGPGLLDSYEPERRPAAQIITQSGDLVEQAQIMTNPMERSSRDQAITARLADPDTRHHEVVAETELNIDYSQSPIVTGDANGNLTPPQLTRGQRLPQSISLQQPDAQSRRLYTLAHRAGHTLMLLAGPSANTSAHAGLRAAVNQFTTNSPLFETAIALSTRHDLPAQNGYLEPAAAVLLGLEGHTLLAVRPDGYIGLRSDRDHLNALTRYRNLIQTGHS